jgi:aminoglycoside phosphotransferase (APT) family kinase protein
MDASGSAEVVRTRAEAASLERPPLLVLEALEAYLDAEGIGTGPASAEPLAGGHSNVTFVISRGGRRVVLRRPPRPPLPPGAHDVVREGRVMSALERTGVPVPRVLSVCESPGVIGAPFLVMEHVEGHVLEDRLPAMLESPGQRHRIAEAFIEVLVAVHEVDIDAAELGWLGRRSGYLERQLRRFAGSWEVNRTRQLPTMTELERALRERMPTPTRTTLVHGDARLGNAIFAPRAPAEVAALLDWEMAALGDPLADLGYLCIAWTDLRDASRPMFHLSPVTGEPGFPTRDELVGLYESCSGRGVTDLPWYMALAYWKSAVFMEGNYRRALYGMSDDAFALGFRFGVEELAELGLAAIREWSGRRRRGIGGITARPQGIQRPRPEAEYKTPTPPTVPQRPPDRSTDARRLGSR